MDDERLSPLQKRMHAVLRGFKPAPEPRNPVRVKQQGGTPYSWVCKGCKYVCVGEPTRTQGQSWYCADCA